MAGTDSFPVRILNGLLALRATILLIFASGTASKAATFLDCPTGFANFGDALTDTGNRASMYPLAEVFDKDFTNPILEIPLPDIYPFIFDPDIPPYGETFFGKPSKRLSNGRLVPDFFSLAFRKPLLDPYVKAVSYDYKFGVNFAEAESLAVYSSTLQPANPYPIFPSQLNQFKRFFNSVIATESNAACASFYTSTPLPFGTSWVSNWLFTIQIGGEEVYLRFIPGAPQAPVYPDGIAAGIITTIRELYNFGARKFLVFGTPALGCSVRVLLFRDKMFDSLDSLGCLTSTNKVAQDLNSALLTAIRALRPNLPGANIAFFDYYAAHTFILQNPTTFGFTVNTRACCGSSYGIGFQYNFNDYVTCGRPGMGANVCPNPDQYISWDGYHFTDAFYEVIAIFALYGLFTDGGINYAATCSLDFSKFSSKNTFRQAYPFGCQTIFA